MKLCEIFDRQRLAALLSRFSQVRIGVIGDFALDAYWQVDMTRARLSRETPHFSRPVVSETYSPGAGGNAAQNLAALGAGEVSAFSIVGDDLWGSRLRLELGKKQVQVQGMLTCPGWHTNAYIKPVLQGYETHQEDARLDIVNNQPMAQEMEEGLLASFESQLPRLEAVLVMDQIESSGVLTPRLCERLTELAESHPQIYFLADSRLRIGQFRHMILKPNRQEALAAYGPGFNSNPEEPARLEEAARHLEKRSGRPVFVTMGGAGVLVCRQGELTSIEAAPVRPPLDIVGAGDAFLAALAAALAAGGTWHEAAATANLAAAVTVEKLGQTGTAAPAEILERYEQTRSAR